MSDVSMRFTVLFQGNLRPEQEAVVFASSLEQALEKFQAHCSVSEPASINRIFRGGNCADATVIDTGSGNMFFQVDTRDQDYRVYASDVASAVAAVKNVNATEIINVRKDTYLTLVIR